MRSPIIRHVDTDGIARSGDLYETFAALSAGSVDHFTALRPHQTEVWHIFTVQVAVLAIEKAGLDAAPTDAGEWRHILHALTPRWTAGEPWHLVVDDLDCPALLQPAIAAEDLSGGVFETPDQLDVLVSGRNHEIKNRTICNAQDDDWLFALVTLQTSEGSMGAGTKAVSRINGGYASRTTMRLVPPGGSSASFLRDVAVLLRQRRASPPPSTPVILWTEPWAKNPDTPLLATELDPLYVEICRRVRLSDEGVTHVRKTKPTSSVPVSSVNGVANCPWTPIVLSDKGSKSFSPGPVRGYRVPALLMDRTRTQRPLLAEAHPEDVPGGEIRIQGLRRGQGATERLDVYGIPIPGGDPIQAMSALDVAVHEHGAAHARAWTIVRTALISARQGAPDRIRFDDAASSQWADEAEASYDELVDREARDMTDVPAETMRRRAAEIARQTFERRIAMLPGATTPRGIATSARSHGMLEAMLYKFVNGDTDGQ